MTAKVFSLVLPPPYEVTTPCPYCEIDLHIIGLSMDENGQVLEARFQHGPNPEHSLYRDMSTPLLAFEGGVALAEWLVAIHGRKHDREQ